MERKEKTGILVWGLGMLYALAASLYTTLFGCGCPDTAAMGDCHRMHLPEVLGAVGWMLLVPAGLWLFRRNQGILRIFGTYIGATVACGSLWLIESLRRASGAPFGYSPGGLGMLLMAPVHGLHGSGGLSERWWLVLVLVWTAGLWIFAGCLEKKYHPRTDKPKITFLDVYQFAFVLLGVIHLLCTAEALDLLIVANPDRLPEVWYIVVTGLWLVVTVGALRHFRHTGCHAGWMKGLFVLCLIRSIGLLVGGVAFLLADGWYLTPFLLVGCTSPMLLPVELFWNLLSFGPPEWVNCFMALALELSVMLPAYVFYRRDFPGEKKKTALLSGERSLS
ncbi:MAG: hypothetical protein IKV57_02915 [Clostridia bacterium]|nr:hypothetical protein [Clostridia bacterium]